MQNCPVPPSTPFGLCRLIGQIRSEIVLGIEQAMQRDGVDLNFSQFLALKRLGENGPVAPGELARTLNYNPGAMTRLLDKLEQRGYLKRVPDPSDRRALRLELTQSGKAIHKRVIECSNAAAERAFACTSEPERAKLHVLLGRVLEGMQLARKQPTQD